MAVAALLASIWYKSLDGCRGGMLLLLVVVAKIFFIDMAELGGLWRVASFMGLGLTLLALAWLHRRLAEGWGRGLVGFRLTWRFFLARQLWGARPQVVIKKGNYVVA